MRNEVSVSKSRQKEILKVRQKENRIQHLQSLLAAANSRANWALDLIARVEEENAKLRKELETIRKSNLE
jgi:hypothetical protein